MSNKTIIKAYSDKAGPSFGVEGGSIVTSENPITDNRLVKGDTSSTGIQESGITVSDNNDLSGLVLETYVSEPAADFTITSGNTGFHPRMDIGSGRTLTIDSGAAFHTMSTLTNDGTLVNNGTLYIG